ncbi:MAG: hypothetical protein H7Y11_12875, partial [Armatimonadetes bacterium]|nr:hypothetical protein [Anaerolineae bacterium]
MNQPYIMLQTLAMRLCGIICLLGLIMSSSVSAQGDDTIPVVVPFRGKFLFVGQSINNGLIGFFELDALSQLYNTALISNQGGRYLHWNQDGDKILFKYPSATIGESSSGIFDTVTATDERLLQLSGFDRIFTPQGWSNDTSKILYVGYVPPTNRLEMLDRTTDTLLTLLTYTENQPLNQQFPLIPLPSDSANALFFGIHTADWNPIHQEWIALKITLGGEETARLYANVLYNYVTGDMVSLDAILSASTDA